MKAVSLRWNTHTPSFIVPGGGVHWEGRWPTIIVVITTAASFAIHAIRSVCFSSFGFCFGPELGDISEKIRRLLSRVWKINMYFSLSWYRPLLFQKQGRYTELRQCIFRGAAGSIGTRRTLTTLAASWGDILVVGWESKWGAALQTGTLNETLLLLAFSAINHTNMNQQESWRGNCGRWECKW